MQYDEETPETEFRSPRVLVVEDDPDTAEAMTDLLECFGIECQAARDGEEALQKTLEFLPDVVFLDLNLPRLGGYETACRLRRSPVSSPDLIVAVSGQPDDRELAFQTGVDMHLSKPVEAASLMKVIALWRSVCKAEGC